MNRKIFTLLLGAIMIVSSVFTVNAQPTPSRTLPYTPKTEANEVNFSDLLTSDIVNNLPGNLDDSYFLLSVTGIANPTSAMSALSAQLDLAFTTNTGHSLVLMVDTISDDERNLRLEYLWKLDDEYEFLYGDSHKFGALRHSLWCVKPDLRGVPGSNITYDFMQIETGIPLKAPLLINRDATTYVWKTAHDTNEIYDNPINTLDDKMIVSGWHFSQTYASTQPLQKNMPLYSYVTTDSVVVFVLDDNAPYDPVAANGNTGGYKVSIKHVAVADLIKDAIGNVNTGGPGARPTVENVLLFTLKKVNKFVMNANDWNAVNAGIKFEPNANKEVENSVWGNKYYNPFTRIDNVTNYAPLTAYEVNDSLYHYGYMQFERTTNSSTAATNPNFLYVDTAWVNIGINQFLAFGWGQRRDNSEWAYNPAAVPNPIDLGYFRWGNSFRSSAGSAYHGEKPIRDNYLLNGIYWRLDSLIWETLKLAALQNGILMSNLLGTGPAGAIYNSTSLTTVDVTFTLTQALNFDEVIADAVAKNLITPPWGNYSPLLVAGTYTLIDAGISNVPNDELGLWDFTTDVLYKFRPGFTDATVLDYTADIAFWNLFDFDSLKYIFNYMQDSIMENQSKFRVVYDPSADSTFINVYQSRVQYPDYTNGSHNAVTPPWWTNSFGLGKDVSHVSFWQVDTVLRPSDLYTGLLYDVAAWTFTPPTSFNSGTFIPDITAAAKEYYDTYVVPRPYHPTFTESRISNYEPGVPATQDYWDVHGPGANPVDKVIFNFHSFMLYYPQSTVPGIDRVLISTADTCGIYDAFNFSGGADFSALGHMYGWSVTNHPSGLLTYKDSLLYVDLQDLGGDNRIITLDQSYKNGVKQLDTRIRINYGDACPKPQDAPDPQTGASIDNDLYLIRNTMGQYLCVPLWSITDSIYWVTPESNEDLTKMPCYQWIVKNIRTTPGSPFRLINREFERVDIPFMYVYDTPRPFDIGNDYSDASFNNMPVIGGATTEGQALAIGEVDPNNFVNILRARFPEEDISFIRLGKSVKENQLLGYKYIDKDSTYIDVYAFKFLHWQRKNLPVYLSWDGYNSNDTVLYAEGEDSYDKLYFNLQEMTYNEIHPVASAATLFNGRIMMNRANTRNGQSNADFQALYDQFASKKHTYFNVDSLVMERFGYWETNNGIKDLKPMARQAYRLFLQDYYRWHPTQNGHYVTVGENDRYILADKANATKPYQKGSHSVVNLFGAPHFYFRETFFDVYNTKGNDYFAMVQRLDTFRSDVTDKDTYFTYLNWGVPHASDIEDYLTLVHGSTVAKKVMKQIIENQEFGLALLDIHPSWLRASFVVRGDAAVNSNTSAFQLERDEEPIYRRFHKNEPNERFGGDLWDTDLPDTVEFHLLNQAERGNKLYENSGNYLDVDNKSDLFGADGGRIYNRDKDGRGDYYVDTLGHVISFLGMSNVSDYPETNRAFFLDTAFINRGTGWIKPQYLIAVDPYNPIEQGDCDVEMGGPYDLPNKPYVLARYLYNTAQYAKAVKDSVQNANYDWEYTDEEYTLANPSGTGSTNGVFRFKKENFNKVEPINESVLRKPNGIAYTYDDKWERLAFAWAIHHGDSLYVLKGKYLEPGYQGNPVGDPKRVWETLVEEYGGGTAANRYFDFKEFLKVNIARKDDGSANSYLELYYRGGDRGGYEFREYNRYRTVDDIFINDGKTIGIHAIIDLSDNTHKDWVFSFRYVERNSSDFIIESETSKRDIRNAAIIRPGYGGWIKWQNGVPVITRSDEKDNMGQAGGSVMNVKQLNNPVGNEVLTAAANAIEVIGGKGAVTILNATGKKVIVSNMLGQTVANVTLNSDNASIPAPAGVIVVAIQGESASKVVVK